MTAEEFYNKNKSVIKVKDDGEWLKNCCVAMMEAYHKHEVRTDNEIFNLQETIKIWNMAYIDALSIDEEGYSPTYFEDFIKRLKQ